MSAFGIGKAASIPLAFNYLKWNPLSFILTCSKIVFSLRVLFSLTLWVSFFGVNLWFSRKLITVIHLMVFCNKKIYSQKVDILDQNGLFSTKSGYFGENWIFLVWKWTFSSKKLTFSIKIGYFGQNVYLERSIGIYFGTNFRLWPVLL